MQPNSSVIEWVTHSPTPIKGLLILQSSWVLWKVCVKVSDFDRYRVVQLGWTSSMYQLFAGGLLARVRQWIPAVRKEVEKSLEKTLTDLEHSVKKAPPVGISPPPPVSRLPAKGFASDTVKRNLVLYKGLSTVDYGRGLISGTVYHGGKDLSNCIAEAVNLFSHSNPLHPDVFPGIRQMEAEVISMVINLFHGTPGVTCGTITRYAICRNNL